MLLFLLSLYIRDFEFSFSIQKEEEYVKVYLPGKDLTHEVGKPQLPRVSYLIPVAGNPRIYRVKLEDTTWAEIRGVPYPVQVPYPLISRPKRFISLKELSPYPSSILSYETTSGCILISLIPARFIPPDRIRLLKAGRLVVEYDVLKEKKGSGLDYVIITSQELDTAFQELKRWKEEKGLRTAIYHVEDIELSYPGRDLQEKIRNFIKEMHENYGARWVLLGGDVDIIPEREAFAMSCEAGFMSDEDSIPCDLYYADLDGTWDEDGDNIFGEVEDSVDLYPDVYVGRAPVDTLPDAFTFVRKVINYEKNPPPDYLKRILFCAEILWDDPYTDQSIAKEKIDSLFIPDYMEITKLYESWGNESTQTVVQAINSGMNLFNHDGHGWIWAMGVGKDYLVNDIIDTLKNSDMQGILYSIGCWVGAFDYDAISEHWIRNPQGGGVAAIANARYGWGSPGNPGFGYSDRFDFAFYDVLFNEDNRIGRALALTKARFIPYSRDENVYRWHQYQLNLLGDPEMSVWTEPPLMLEVSAPDSVPQYFDFTVYVKKNGTPFPARVCLLSSDTMLVDSTDLSGKVHFSGSTGDPSMLLTVVAKNAIPYQREIRIKGKYSLNAFLEEPDGYLNPDDTVSLGVIVNNSDTETLSLTLNLYAYDTTVYVLDGSEAIKLPPLTQDTFHTAFSFYKKGGKNGEVVKLNAGGYPLEFTVGECKFVCDTFFISPPSPQPSSSGTLFVCLKNAGFSSGFSVLRQAASDLFLPSPEKPYPEIPPGETYIDTIPFVVPSFDVPSFGNINIYHSGSSLIPDSFSFTIPVGFILFEDDAEIPGDWLATGHWHLSERRSHSGTYSWYCGVDSFYLNNMDDSLLSPPLILSSPPVLSFYAYLRVTIYGNDGLYVEVLNGEKSETLDYIGSGGALKDLVFGWAPYTYSIPFPPGDTIRLLFRWVSDSSDTSEGIYIDDIKVNGMVVPESGYGKESKISFSRINSGSIALRGEGEVDIFDVCGRKVKSVKVPGFSSIVLPPGVYFLKIQEEIAKILLVR